MAQEATGRPPEETLSLWKREQALLRARVVDRDTEPWQRDPAFSGLRRVGGVDVSFAKGDGARACASLVVLRYPELEVVYEDCRMVSLTAPYLSGFLAFREVPFLVDAVRRLQEEEPSLMPQVLFVDGNGVLHHRGFGVACHLGVLTDLPCVGVAKKLLQVDGLENHALHRDKIRRLRAAGDAFPLTGDSGAVLGMDRQAGPRDLPPAPDPTCRTPGAEEPRAQHQAAVRVRGPQGESGDSCAPDPQLLQVPHPGARAPGRHPLPRPHPQEPGGPRGPRARAGEEPEAREAKGGPQGRLRSTHG